MVRVYVVEAQTLFEPLLARLVLAAGGHLVGAAALLDLDALVAGQPAIALLDLDFSTYDVAAVLSDLRARAPVVRSVVLSADRDPGWLARCRRTGAASVLAKAATEAELVHDLRVVLDGGEVWDKRVESS